MKLLVVRASARDPADYQDAARAYGECLRPWFDGAAWVHTSDIGGTCQPPASWPTVPEARARALVRRAAFPLVLSCTSPDHYACYFGALNVGLSFCDTEALPRRGAEKPWVAGVRAMDALWVPDIHSLRAFEQAGVGVPARVVPYPIIPGHPPPDDESEGIGFDLDGSPLGMVRLIRFAKFRGNLLHLQPLMRRLGPAVGELAVKRLRMDVEAVSNSHPVLLCAGRDEPRQGLRLLLAEWMESRRSAPQSPWTLLIHTAPAIPDGSRFDLVASLWEHVQALKRQLDAKLSRVLLRFSSWDRFEPTRFVPLADAVVHAALGGGFAPALAAARALGKTIICPREAEDSNRTCPDIGYKTTPVILSCLGERQDSYDPVSAWPVPAPHALASVITQLQADRAKLGERPDFEEPPASSTEVVACELKRLEARFMRRTRTHGGPRPSRRRSASR